MTTYSITGVQIERDIDDNVINVTDVALELVFAPNSTPTVNYSIDADNPPTEDEPLPLVDIDGAGIIGATIGDINLSDDANDFDDYFGFVDHSGGRSHILNFTDRPVGAAATDYIFVFGGDALPDVVASNDPVAAWLALEDSITNAGQSSSPFGPGDEISVANVPDVNITENDVILGNAYDQTLDGGIGNDKIYGEGGDDTLIGGAGNDTLYGGGGENEMYGGAGDDLFIVDADSEDDYIELGLGNDTVDLTNTSAADISIDESGNAGSFTINMASNTGSISTGSDGTATLLGVDDSTELYLYGSDTAGDVFDIALVDGGWIGLQGSFGNDAYNFGSSTGGIVRIDLSPSNGSGNNVNLTTGTINDALGGTDTITGQDAVKIELRGSMVNDTILGSDRDERFILMAGDDTLDAGGGQDLLRYDRSGVDAVTVDLSAGTASGVWRGEAFSHSITGIEEVRGSRQGDDVITGSDAAERFEGRGGDDTIVGGGGDDTVGFQADRSAATVTDLGNGQVQIASDDGTDVISGVENFAFNDGTVDLATLLGNVSDSGSTTITYVGTENDFIGTAFLDDDNNTSVDIVSNTGTQLVLRNSATGYTSTLIGTGITFSGAAGEEVPTGGTITGISIVDGDGVAQGTITDINWDLVEFSDALDAVADNDNVAPLADLFSSNGTLTVDGSGATVALYSDDLLGSDITTLLTQPMDIIGSDGDDSLIGGAGDDTIVGGGGDDTVGFQADRSAATVTELGNGQVQIASDDGTDVISGVENFAFNDGTVDLATLLGNVSDSGSTTITYVGTENDFIGTAFLDDDNNTSVDIVSNTGTQLVLKNSATGYTSTLIGTGITFSGAAGEEVPTGGTITGISIVDGDGVAQGTITDINWDLVEFSDALDAVADNDNVAPLADLFSSNGTLTVDGSGATFDLYLDDLLGSDITTLLTQPMDIIGSDGDDSLIGGAGADYIEAGGGNDTIDASIGAASSQNWGDYIKPGAGTNTIIGHQDLFEVSNDGLDIGYQDVSNSGGIILTVGENGSGTAVSNTAGVVNDTFTYAHRFDGTHQNDRFEGSANSNWEGWGGNGGDDTINAGEGYDELLYHFDSKRGGSGAITVNFETGTATDGFGDTDTFTGIEAVRGTAQNDVFIGSEALGFISYRGLDGNDTITGSTAWDRADYSKDANYGGSGAITADLSAGTILDGFGTTDQVSDIDQVRGTNQGDSMTAAGLQQGIQFEGRDGNDTLTGGGGDDTIYGGNNFDTISAGEGNDEVHGGNGRDLIFLNQGDDLFIDNGQGGELGRDTVFTGLGNDTVQGGNGDDVFFGEDGNDVINARLGNDTVYGGNNFDTISAGEGNDEVHGGNGRDLIFLNQGDDLFIDNGQGGELGRDTVFTGLGNDTVEGGNGDDVFFGEDGNDVINARLGNDTIYGGNNFDTISAGAGNDEVHGGNGRDLIFLNQGDDIYYDNGQGGELGRDTVYTGLGNDTVEGGNGDDLFFGEAGDDLIFARLGADTLEGGAGNDTLNGGEGADTFVFEAADTGTGQDIVQDFERGTDTLEIRGATKEDVSYLYNSSTEQVTVSISGATAFLVESQDNLADFGMDDMSFV